CDSIIDYVFRWLANEFIHGYKKAHEPKQPELNMPGLEEVEKKSVNRPIAELPLTDETEFLTLAAAEQNDSQAPSSSGVAGLSAAVAHFQQDAPTCPNCGNVVVRNGACYKCLNCGESLGCS
ncbi:MAG: ribonucleoside-diphosphate reductase alpha chain, partial [Candidatus Binatia bacterium]